MYIQSPGCKVACFVGREAVKQAGCAGTSRWKNSNREVLALRLQSRKPAFSPIIFTEAEIHGLVLLRHRRFDSTNHLVRERCRAVMIAGDDLS